MDHPYLSGFASGRRLNDGDARIGCLAGGINGQLARGAGDAEAVVYRRDDPLLENGCRLEQVTALLSRKAISPGGRVRGNSVSGWAFAL